MVKSVGSSLSGQRGRAEQGGRLYVASRHYRKRSMPHHLTLKKRAASGMRTKGLADLAAELEERERAADRKRLAGEDKLEEDVEEKVKEEVPKVFGSLAETERKYADIDADEEDDDVEEEEEEEEEEGEEDEEEEESEEEESDTEALLAELEKIKKERAEENARRKAAEERERADALVESAMTSNPLMVKDEEDGGMRSSATVQKKWFEDTVFVNQSRAERTAPEKRFINDPVRNDFHLRFIHKYIM